MQDKNTCCNQECNQDRDCPVRNGTHKPAEAVLQIQEPAPVQVAPAVVAVPDERAAFEAHIKARPNYFDGMLANGKYANGFKVIDIDNQWIGWKARAALAATPATTDEPPFLQRLRTEQHDLSERHQKISVFIVSPAFQMLTDDDKGLLRKQEAQQHVLLQTLNQRIHSASEKHMREKNNG